MVEETLSFLHAHSPFDRVKEADLDPLARSAEIVYLPTRSVVFTEGEHHLPYCYVLMKGIVELRRGANNELVDICDPGELFGIRAAMAKDYYLSTAIVAEDALLYRFPIEQIEALAARDGRISWFLASGFAAGVATKGVGMHQAHAQHHSPMVEGQSLSSSISGSLAKDHSRTLLQCQQDETVAEAVRAMAERNVGSVIIIDEQQRPVGIFTDTDLRKKVVGKGLQAEEISLKRVMSSPVATEREDASFEELVVKLVQHGVGHLVLTSNGRPNTPATGMVSEHDILLARANHPAVLMRQIKDAQHTEALEAVQRQTTQLVGDYLEQGWSLVPLARMVTTLRDAIALRAVELVLEENSERGGRLAARGTWLVLGSEGRGEQMLPSDQDSAIILPNELEPEAEQRIAELTEAVSLSLHEVGYELCPAGVMSSRPKWRRSLEDWKREVGRWIETPTPQAILEAQIFFDFRTLYGSTAQADELRHWILERLKSHSTLLNYMARSACETPPPLSFFGKFVVEKSGDRKNQFDIKKRALLPLVDAARVLAYDRGMPYAAGTYDRYQWLAERDAEHSNLYKDAADAYAFFLKQRALAGVYQQDSGRYIQPDRLHRMERQSLRNGFNIIEKVQSHLRSHFHLAYFS